MHYVVKKSKNAVIDFDGEKIASSTSYKDGSYRWVEFNLYLTEVGNYVLERVGRSDIFHVLGCEVANRNNLKFDPDYLLENRHMACEVCQPDEYNDVLVLEEPRYFGLWSDSPDAILEALHRKKDGSKYTTLVTERLLEEASQHDKQLERAYRVEHVR